MNTPYTPGAVLDPDTLGDDLIAMRWRPIPRKQGVPRRDHPGDSPPLEASWCWRRVTHRVHGEDELNETFLRLAPAARGVSPPG